MLNRKEIIDQESIQIPNTFRSRHQRERRRTHLKQRHHNQNTTSKKPKGQFLSKINGQTAIEHKTKQHQDKQAKGYCDKIVNHSRGIALEQSVKKTFVQKIDFTWPQPSPLILPWYTQDICAFRVMGF